MGFEHQKLRRGIGDEVVDDPPDTGRMLEIVGIGKEFNIFGDLKTPERIGAGPDRMLIKTAGHDIFFVLEDMFGNDCCHPRLQRLEIGGFIVDSHVIRAVGLHTLDIAEFIGIGGIDLRRGDQLIGKKDIFGGKRDSVTPSDPFSQSEMERFFIDKIVTFGQFTPYFSLFVIIEQSIEDPVGDLPAGRIGGDQRIELGGIGGDGEMKRRSG